MSVFETTIRILGGLLSAYQLSGDHVFLDKCACHPLHSLVGSLLAFAGTCRQCLAGRVLLSSGWLALLVRLT